MKIETLESLVRGRLKDADLNKKAIEMLTFIIEEFNTDLSDVKYKYTRTDLLSEDAVQQKIIESGYKYISDIMDTITGLQFNGLLAFLDLVSSLKGNRVGMELVLKLLGFDSQIVEWWQADPLLNKPAWSYDIVVTMQTTYVPDVFDTLDKIKTFSRFYVIANIDNVDIQYAVGLFAKTAPIMGGFTHQKYSGEIVQRAM